MKKILLFVLVIMFPVFMFAQRSFEIAPFAGYMFGGGVKYYEGKLKLDDGMNYGISILTPLHSLVDIEFNYTRMDSKASFSPYFGFPLQYRETNLATNYFQIGGVSKFYSQNTQLTPFGSVSIGATWFSPSDGSFRDVWRFSATVGLGAKYMFSERFGIMIRGRLLMPMYFGGIGMYFGTGGSGVSVNSVVAPLQGDFNGGLIIKVGN